MLELELPWSDDDVLRGRRRFTCERAKSQRTETHFLSWRLLVIAYGAYYEVRAEINLLESGSGQVQWAVVAAAAVGLDQVGVEAGSLGLVELRLIGEGTSLTGVERLPIIHGLVLTTAEGAGVLGCHAQEHPLCLEQLGL